MDDRVYILLDVVDGKAEQAPEVLQESPGVVMADALERTPDVIVVKTILREGKPVTAQKVIAKLGDTYDKEASAILDRLVTRGVLAKFRAGLDNYYGSPKELLTSKEPNLGTVVLDSLQKLFLDLRHKVTGHYHARDA